VFIIVLVRSYASPCRICGRQSGTLIKFSPSVLILTYRYHSTKSPNAFLYQKRSKNFGIQSVVK